MFADIVTSASIVSLCHSGASMPQWCLCHSGVSVPQWCLCHSGVSMPQ